jgi:hypothetical protein
MYHEGRIDGWQTNIQGATRVADNLYVVSTTNGTANINTRIQAFEPEEERIPEDPIKPFEPEEPTEPVEPVKPVEPQGCLDLILSLFGPGPKK